MRVILDLDGWRKEIEHEGSLYNTIEVIIRQPLSIAVRTPDMSEVKNENAVKVLFAYSRVDPDGKCIYRNI